MFGVPVLKGFILLGFLVYIVVTFWKAVSPQYT